jgi:hypothetical protein
MDFLPVMLQSALFLSSIGIVVYLWDLDISIAEVVLAITSFGSGFYACITMAATVWRDCPFQTPLSVLLPKVLGWAKAFAVPFRSGRWWKRRIISFLRLVGLLERRRRRRLTDSPGRAFKISAGGVTTPGPAGEGTATTDYPMKLSNPAFWRDDPLFTSPTPKDTAASAGFWLLENSTDFSVAAAVAAVFSKVQLPSHHHPFTALIRLRDTYLECFRAPKPEEPIRLKALQSAAAYYVLYHTQLIWCTWKSLEVEVEGLPRRLPSDLFLHGHDYGWDRKGVFEYLLHVDVEDRSEPVKSARFLSYIAPYWFCGDSNSAIVSRPVRLQTLNKLIEVLGESQALNDATVTDCILCVGAAMDFPLHPEDLIRVDKRCAQLPSYVDGGTDCG